MLADMQLLKDLHLKKFYLANPDRTLLGVLSDLTDKKGTFRLTPYSEISFSIRRTPENESLYLKLTKLQKIFLEDVGWFILEEPEVSSDGISEMKQCTMYSEEYELTGRMLRDFYLNTNTPGSIGTAQDGFVTFYNEENPSLSALHLVLEKFPGWTIGYVHPLLASAKAIGAFSVESQDVYSFLTDSLAKAAQCLFLFDITSHTVNAWPWEHFGETYDVYLSHDSLIRDLSRSPVDESSLVTALFVEGAEGLSIREVNCGFDELYDLSYYYNKMPQELKNAWENWLSLKEAHVDDYRQAILSYTKALDSAEALRNLLPEDSSSQLPEDYGIFALETKLSNINASISNYKEMGFDSPGSSRYLEYLELLEKRKKFQAEKDAKELRHQAFLDTAGRNKKALEEIAAFVSWEKNFNEGQRKLLSHYIREGTYQNDTFLTTSLFTPEQVIQKKWELKEYALDRLSEMARPQYSISTSLSNLAQIEGYEPVLEKMRLGHKITVLFHEFTDIPLRLLSFTLDFDDVSSLSVEYSNASRSRNGVSDLAYLLESDSGYTGNSSSGRSSSYGTSEGGEYVTREELRSQLFNLSLQEKNGLSLSSRDIACLTDLVNGKFNTFDGNYVITKALEADEASIGRLTAKILQSGYAEIDRLVGENASLKLLNTDTAHIKTLLSGSAGVGELQAIRLTAANTVIDEAVIRDLIAAKISVGDLLAQTAVSEEIVLISKEGKPVISFKDGTQQFYDSDGNVRIQIGQDSQGAFHFVVYDETGKGILMDSSGIREAAIKDGTIKNHMIADGVIGKDKLAFETVEANAQGGVDISKIYDGNGGLFGAAYESFKENTTQGITLLADQTSKELKTKIDKSEVLTVYKEETDENGTVTTVPQSKTILDAMNHTINRLEGAFTEVGQTMTTIEGLRTEMKSENTQLALTVEGIRSEIRNATTVADEEGNFVTMESFYHNYLQTAKEESLRMAAYLNGIFDGSNEAMAKKFESMIDTTAQGLTAKFVTSDDLHSEISAQIEASAESIQYIFKHFEHGFDTTGIHFNHEGIVVESASGEEQDKTLKTVLGSGGLNGYSMEGQTPQKIFYLTETGSGQKEATLDTGVINFKMSSADQKPAFQTRIQTMAHTLNGATGARKVLAFMKP